MLRDDFYSRFPWVSYRADANTCAWWKFDETIDGVDFVDSSGNGFDLLNGGVQEGVIGVHGYSAYFDGITDNARCTIAAPLLIPSNITVEGCFSPADLGSGCLAAYWNNNGGPGGGPWHGWNISLSAPSVWWTCRTTDNPGYFGKSATFPITDLTIDNWYSIRCTYDGSFLRMYLMDLTAGETVYTLKAEVACTGNILYNVGIYDVLGFGALNYDVNPAGQSHYKGDLDSWMISDVIRNTAGEPPDILPAAPGAVNMGRKFLEFDSIHCKTLVAGSMAGLVFTGLGDTPDTYAGEAHKVPAVNAGEDALEFIERVESFLDLNDTPAAYAGNANKSVRVNSTPDSLEFVDPADDFLALDDTPSSYSGEAGRGVLVNADEDELEFADVALEEPVSRYIYVDADAGSDSNDGTSWAEAFETLQYAVDSIAPIIRAGAVIHVVCRGVFETNLEEQSTVIVQKQCESPGRVQFEAEGYEYRRAITGAGVNYVEMTVTRGDDFYNGGYVWMSADNTSRGQLRQITDTIQTGGTMRVMVSPNWTTTPTVGHRCNVAGRAQINQDATSQPWRGIEVVGGDTAVIAFGFAFADWDDGEAVPFTGRAGASAQVRACCFPGASAADGAAVRWSNGAQGYALECFVEGTNGPAYDLAYQAYSYLNRCQTVGKNIGLQSRSFSVARAFRFVSTGGVTTGSCTDQSFMELNTTYGTDGSSDGFVASKFSVVSELASVAHTIRRELDVSSYTLKPKRTNQSAQPTPISGEIRVWRDTDDGKVYLIYNDPTGGVKKVEMT